MNICTRCIMPDTRPDTHFSDGVCSACLTQDKLAEVDWAARKNELERLLERHRRRQVNGSYRRRSAEYDCIVPSSGGKDSHWQVLQLKALGAKPLVVTCTTCHPTVIGQRNIDNLGLFADTIQWTPNRDVRARLNRLALTMLGDISWPEHVLIHTWPFRIAVDMGIPLVFYGENPIAAYGGPPGEDEVRRMTRQWVQEFGGFLGMRPEDFVGMEKITAAHMRAYMGPSEDELVGVEAYFLGAFVPWDSRRNAETARRAGMTWSLPTPANWWPFENLDNAQTGIHDEFMAAKYGYSRGQAQLSVDIRKGFITRADAERSLERLREYGGTHRYMGVPLEDVLERIGLPRADYEQLLAKFTTAERDPPIDASSAKLAAWNDSWGGV